MVPDLAEDPGDGVAGERAAASGVESVDRADQPDRADLREVVGGLRPGEPPGAVADEGQVQCHELVAGLPPLGVGRGGGGDGLQEGVLARPSSGVVGRHPRQRGAVALRATRSEIVTTPSDSSAEAEWVSAVSTVHPNESWSGIAPVAVGPAMRTSRLPSE